ncbi:unnamed protein product [Brassica rapa subsp. trilocularis]
MCLQATRHAHRVYVGGLSPVANEEIDGIRLYRQRSSCEIEPPCGADEHVTVGPSGNNSCMPYSSCDRGLSQRQHGRHETRRVKVCSHTKHNLHEQTHDKHYKSTSTGSTHNIHH